MRRAAIACVMILLAGATAGCFVGDEMTNRASRRQIIDAAARCGVPDFKPTEAGAGWAAYVERSVPGHAAKEDCIYVDIERQGLVATR